MWRNASRSRPNNTQKALLEQCFGARRFVYNQQVEAFDSYDRESNPVPKYPNVTDLKNRSRGLGIARCRRMR